MNHRLTLAAAVAVILASVSEFSLISGAAWLVEAIGAVLVVALAGTLTRLSPVPAALGATLLAGLASVPMLVAHSPYWKATAAGIIVACAASATGLRPLRALAGLATYLAALLLYLNVLLAAGRSFLAVIPTPASVHHLASLVQQGTAATKYQPLVPATHGVLLLAAASIGLAAIVVDFLAVRLHRPAIAGLPLLVVYLAPIATTAKVGGLGGAIAFLLAAAGYLALLASDGRYRLRGWGRVVTVWHYSGEDERLGGADIGALAATGRRIGLAAVCAALVAPLLLPGLTLHQLFGGHSGSGGHHVAVGLPDPVAELRGLLTRSSPRRVLTYRTTAVNGENYLQIYVLNYDAAASQWDLIRPAASRAVGIGPLEPAPGVVSGTPQLSVRTTVTIPEVAGFAAPIYFLPAPYWPRQVHVTGSWRESAGTLMIYSGDPSTSGLHYTVTSGEVEPTAAELEAPQHVPAAIEKSYVGFKSAVTPQLTKIAQQVTKGKETAFDKAVALERYFLSSRFSYSLQSNVANSPQGLLSFLNVTKSGYCQQFAFAMSVLARLVGIPSRIAIGYTAGKPGPDGTWLVSTADAHAWPELYFTGVGWLRFEPTPAGSEGQQTAVEPSYVTAAVSGGGGPKGHAGEVTTGPGSVSASASPGVRPPHVQVPGSGSEPVRAARHHGGGAPVGLIVLAVLVLAAVAPGAARVITRRRRWRSASGDAGLALAGWQELCADLEDYGLRCRASESPRALARRIRSDSGIGAEGGQAITRIASVVERARYAPVPAASGTIRTDVALVRRGLARSAGRAARLRAALLPASTLEPLRASIRQAAGLLTGWMPAAGES
jgi:transglutaminase-like putative cysteine protease